MERTRLHGVQSLDDNLRAALVPGPGLLPPHILQVEDISLPYAQNLHSTSKWIPYPLSRPLL